MAVPHKNRVAGRASVWVILVALALAGAMLAAGFGTRSSSAPARVVRPSVTAVTAVPATVPPRTQWNAVPTTGPGTHLGRWRLKSRFLVLAALGGQGLASVTRPERQTALVCRGILSVPPALRRLGFDHVGDPDAWHGYLFDAYKARPSARPRLSGSQGPVGARNTSSTSLPRGRASTTPL